MNRPNRRFSLTCESLSIRQHAPRTSLTIAASIILACFELVCVAFADDPSNPDREFHFKGKPVHPLLFKKFEPWVSDARPPIITQLNLTAAWDSNEYAANFKNDADGTVSITIPEGG